MRGVLFATGERDGDGGDTLRGEGELLGRSLPNACGGGSGEVEGVGEGIVIHIGAIKLNGGIERGDGDADANDIGWHLTDGDRREFEYLALEHHIDGSFVAVSDGNR